MPVSTTNFGLLQPLVNNPSDQDQWGGYLDTNISNDDTLLLTAMVWKTVSETANFSVAGRTAGSANTGNIRNLFLCNCTSGAITGSLPAANAVDNGFSVAFKKEDASANALTIAPAGSDTIDGAASLVVSSQYDSFLLVSDGTSNWNVMAYKHGVVPKNWSINTQEFTTPGSIEYTPTAGLVAARVRMVGGGGAGGGSEGSGYGGGGGGSSGSFAEVMLTAAQITAALSGGSVPGSVGAGGAGGNGAGGNGGASSLTGLMSCPGGLGGQGEAGQNGFSAGGASPAAPTVSVGTVILSQTGQAGGTGFQVNQVEAGPGGSNPLGAGAPFVVLSSAGAHQAGAPGTGYGSGGGGSLNNGADTTLVSGASGQSGAILIDEYIFA